MGPIEKMEPKTVYGLIIIGSAIAYGLTSVIISSNPRIIEHVSSSISRIIEYPNRHDRTRNRSQLIEHANKYHGGIEKLVGREEANSKDWDNDNINDPFYVCNDGTPIVYLTSENDRSFSTSRWYEMPK